jgi:CRP-like cAMP-binding protein
MARHGGLRYASAMSLKTIISLLKRHDLFAGLDPVRLEVLAFTAERPSFEAGDTLFEAGEEALEAYLILDGQAVMLAHVGAPPVPYELRRGEARALRLERGDLIGESALFHEGLRRSTVRAASRLETLAISRYLFQRLMEEFPEMANAVARALTQRLASTGNDIQDLGRQLGRVKGDR